MFSVNTIEMEEEVLCSLLKLLKGKRGIVFRVKTIEREKEVLCSVLTQLKWKKSYYVQC